MYKCVGADGVAVDISIEIDPYDLAQLNQAQHLTPDQRRDIHHILTLSKVDDFLFNMDALLFRMGEQSYKVMSRKALLDQWLRSIGPEDRCDVISQKFSHLVQLYDDHLQAFFRAFGANALRRWQEWDDIVREFHGQELRVVSSPIVNLADQEVLAVLSRCQDAASAISDGTHAAL